MEMEVLLREKVGYLSVAHQDALNQMPTTQASFLTESQEDALVLEIYSHLLLDDPYLRKNLQQENKEDLDDKTL